MRVWMMAMCCGLFVAPSAATPAGLAQQTCNVVAIASAPFSVEATTPEGAWVTLDGSQSENPEGENLTFQWSMIGDDGDPVFLGSTASLGVVLPLGNRIVTLTVTAESGSTSSATVIVRVSDTRPPRFDEGSQSVRLFTAPMSEFTGANQVYRLSVPRSGDPEFELEILDPDGTTLDRPFGVAFSPSGELWVVNRGSSGGSIGRIGTPLGEPALLGTAGSAPFNSPHMMTFRGNELFVSNYAGLSVLRFAIDADGGATLIEEISTPAPPYGLAFAPWGELMVSQDGSHEIVRFIFDESGNAVSNGSFSDGLDVPFGMAFSPWGELFVTNYGGNFVSRFHFDSDGAAVSNGFLPFNGLSTPVDLAFTPWGELFVSNHLPSHESGPWISRWLFDDTRRALPNNLIEVPNFMGGLALMPEGSLADMTVEQTTLDGGVPTGPLISDSVDSSPTLERFPAGVLPLGPHTVRWTVSDYSGNTASAVQNVLVVDTTAPTVTAPAAIVVGATGADGATVTVPAPAVQDNCDSDPAIDPWTGNGPTLFPLGTTVIEFTVTDASGNQATATTTVTVEDTTAPAITAPSGGSYPFGSQIQLGSPAVSDAVDPDPVVTNDAPDSFEVGQTVITWTATDAAGNAATATQTITVFNLAGLGNGVSVGPGCSFGSGVELQDGAQVGSDVSLGDGTIVGENVTVGDGVETGADVVLKDGADIGDFVVIGDGAIVKENAQVGEGARIGAGATIKAGSSIGANAAIGAGAIIGINVVIGAGAAIGDQANVKDGAAVGADSRIGSQAIIKAGVTVGSGASVGDGVKVNSNVANGQSIGGSPTPPTVP